MSVKMILRQMRIQNFKGIPETQIDFDDRQTLIFGDNATGKTTVFDAFLWLLFGKDSTGRTTFEVKPLDTSGQEIHNLDITVECSFLVDGQPVILQKTQQEDWTKPRGTTQQVFKGNVTSYWINRVPVKSGEYAAYISGTVAEDVFKLVTNPAAFNALDWKNRRAKLMEISGVDIDRALLSEKRFFPLADDMAARNIKDMDALRKVYADQRKQYNDQLKVLPARIDEVHRMTAGGLADAQHKDTIYYLEDAEKTLQGIELQIAQAQTADPRTAAQEQLRQAVARQQSRERILRQEHTATRNRLESEYKHARGASERLKAELGHADSVITARERSLASLVSKRDELRNQYRTEYETAYMPPEVSDTCPTCGQPTPDHMIAETHQKHQQGWQESKDALLIQIRADGTRMSEVVESENAVLQEERARYDTLSAEHIAACIQEKAALEAKESMPDFAPDADAEYAEACIAVARCQKALEDCHDDGRMVGLTERKAEISTKIAEYRAVLAKHGACQEARARVDALEKEQADTGAALADIEGMIMLAEDFIAARCSALEESINKLFPSVHWKLFDEQINGGLVDTCICMVGGVPYSDANNAARINAGLEIINVLCGYYGVSVPVFVDNSESVNRIAGTVGQKICLIVSNDATLRVESGKNERAVA